MAETPIVTAMLVSVVVVYLFGVGTPVFAADVPCKDRCNLSHGTCSWTGECRCHPGWEGPNCEQCTLGPRCGHGTCHQPWQCNCLPGWGGRHCTIDLKVCERTQPCMNDGTCINIRTGDYLCVCKDGFEGIRCETYNPYDPSYDNIYMSPVSTTTLKPAIPVRQCKNGGMCKISALKGGCKKCICKPGFTGDLCETTVNDCLAMPCANGGKCYDMHNDVHCECERGFTGRFCEDDINECEVVGNMGLCHNGGTCVNTFGSYDCVCATGYTGVRCDEATFVEVETKPFISLTTRIIASTDKATTPFETTTSLPVEKSVPADNVDLQRETIIIHEVTYKKSNSTMLILTFLFMGIAILFLGAILGLVWVRCFRNQSIVQSDKDAELAAADSKIPTVAKKVTMNRKPIYRPRSTHIVETASNFIEEIDESTQPCLSHLELTIDDVPDCPSPPPPYALSAVDVRRNPTVRQPFFVALPAKARRSTSQLTEKRRVLMAAYDITSRDDTTENSTLLEADSPTLSHKIVV